MAPTSVEIVMYHVAKLSLGSYKRRSGGCHVKARRAGRAALAEKGFELVRRAPLSAGLPPASR